jgi:hypothetical protein
MPPVMVPFTAVVVFVPVVMSVVVVMIVPHIKVCQDKEAGEPVIPPPKRVWNPGVKIRIVRGRCIVCNNRGPLF